MGNGYLRQKAPDVVTYNIISKVFQRECQLGKLIMLVNWWVFNGVKQNSKGLVFLDYQQNSSDEFRLNLGSMLLHNTLRWQLKLLSTQPYTIWYFFLLKGETVLQTISTTKKQHFECQ